MRGEQCATLKSESLGKSPHEEMKFVKDSSGIVEIPRLGLDADS